MDPEHIILQEYQDRYWVAFGHPWDHRIWPDGRSPNRGPWKRRSLDQCPSASGHHWSVNSHSNRANGRQVIASLAEKMTINLKIYKYNVYIYILYMGNQKSHLASIFGPDLTKVSTPTLQPFI